MVAWSQVSLNDCNHARADRRSGYDGAIRYVDSELDRLFGWLQSKRLLGSTLLIAFSDHGEELWDHGGSGHGETLYAEQLRVPLIVRPPAGVLPARGRSNAPVGLIDVTPTVLDYLGIPSLPWMQGVSLRPWVESEIKAPERTLYAEAPTTRNARALIRGEVKFVLNRKLPLDLLDAGYLVPNLRAFYKFRDDELFLLDRDPAEKDNLVVAEKGIGMEYRAQLVDQLLLTSAPVGSIRRPAPAPPAHTIEALKSLGYIR